MRLFRIPQGRARKQLRSHKQSQFRACLSGRTLRPRLEVLESRRLLATYVVTTNADVGAGSLRQAIIDANASVGADTISFNIGGGGPQTITPLTALPTITDSVQILGNTQPGFAGSPLIELRGDSVSTGNPVSNRTGLTIGAASVLIQQLVINRFANEGIWVNVGNATIVQNYIGTDRTGAIDLGNVGNGIFVATGADGNLIASNLVSGNDATGILLSSNSNKLQANRIGTNVAGTVSLGNGLSGVWMYGGSSNVIGVDGNGIGDASEGNLLSGNGTFGVYFQGDSDNNIIAGNLIGTDALGTSALGNTGGGINFFNDGLADGVRIGTDSNGTSDALERNVISGNANYGIVDFGNNTKIAGNYVGTKSDGLSALANAQGGISLASGGAIVGGAFVAARNIVSGNAGFGIALSGSSSLGNLVQGNYIGLNKNGDLAVPNTGNGIVISSSNNAIGGTTTAARNVISGNGGYGIQVSGSGATNNSIFGNYIGLDQGGTIDVGNFGQGVFIDNAFGNRIGSGVSGGGNVIAGNGGGIAITGTATSASYNRVQGNLIGMDFTGSVSVPNDLYDLVIAYDASANIVGTDSDGSNDASERNYFGGATTAGILIQEFAGYAKPANNVIAGNNLGLNKAGTARLGLYSRSIWLSGGTGTRIGTNTDGLNDDAERNVIVPTGAGTEGILILEPTLNTTVAGNFIGTNPSGTTGLADPGSQGITILAPTTATTGNVIGGFKDAARNIISGLSIGINLNGAFSSQNTVVGNYIGTDVDGLNSIPNVTGIVVNNGASNNTIGGIVAGSRNIISGNIQEGVYINDSDGTKIQGNYIGLKSDGLAALPNGTDGIALAGTAKNVVIGGTLSAAANYISGNARYGVALSGTGTGNQILGNVIGLNTSDVIRGNAIAGITNNGGAGVTIGGTVPGSRNVISGNSDGIWLVASSNNIIQGNYIGTNTAGTSARGNAIGIVIDSGSTNNQIGGATSAARNLISGNNGSGIEVNPASPGNFIQGNYIGTDVSGTLDLGNVGDGILAASPVQIGGLTDLPGTGLGNVISGNKTGLGSGNIRFTADGMVVQGNIIGLDKLGNNVINTASSYGIWSLLSNNAVIGGNDPRSRNVISGSSLGLLLQGGTGHTVANNYVGTDITGNLARGNTSLGITTDASNTTFRNNLISGNLGTGLTLTSTSPTQTTFQVSGNIIGLNAQGNAKLGNAGDGIDIVGSRNVTVGGTTPADRNVISGNSSSGIIIRGGLGTINVSVLGNYIGTDASGNSALGNTTYGILISDVPGVRVGGTAAGAGNLISGNALSGISISGPTSTATLVSGNYVGTNQSGQAAVPNAVGVQITAGANANTIGGASTTARNLVSGNSTTGVLITDSSNNTVSFNRIGTNVDGNSLPNAIGVRVDGSSLQNSLADNEVRNSSSDNFLIEAAGTTLRRNISTGMSGLPIRLATATLAPGAAIITQVIGGNTPTIQGTVTASPNQTYTIELFSASAAGSAERFLSASTVNTNAAGVASFSITPPTGAINGFVSATLTGLGSNGSISTSQLSSSVSVTPVVILGLPSQSPEGTPITLTAFSSTNAVNGYLWQVTKDGLPYSFDLRNDGAQSEAGIQFTPDNQGNYAVSLRVTLSDGTQFLLGPYAINVFNVAPTPSFEYTPNNPSGGSPITFTANNSDPGQLDTLKTSWTVRADSPTGPIVFSSPASTSNIASFTPSGGGQLYATMTVDDGDGGVRTLTRSISVSGLPSQATFTLPTTTATEGDRVRAYAAEALLNRTESLSFNWTLTKTPISGAATTYPFLVTSAGVIEFTPNDDGVYTVGLTVSDFSGSRAAPTQTVTVGNANPRVTITGGGPVLVKGVATTFTATVTDPGTADSQSVAWQIFKDFATTPVATGTGSSFTYTPTSAGTYRVVAQSTDDDYIRTAPTGKGSTQTMFAVSDAAVNVTIIPPAGFSTNSSFIEGTAYTFSTLVPAGITSYAWTARSANGQTVATATSSTFTFSPLQGGDYQIALEVTTASGTKGNAIFSPMKVIGAAPTISSLTIVSPTTTPIFEGTPVTVRTVASDPREAIGLTYLWELQKPGQSNYAALPALDGAPTDFRFTPTNQGSYKVRVSVRDSQGLTTQQTLTVSILNDNPTARIDAVYDSTLSPNSITFKAIGGDPASDDLANLRYEWSVNGSNYSSPSTSNQFVASLTGLNSIKVRVTDGDGGSIERSFFVVQGSVLADNLNIDAATVAASGNADQILVLALDGDDHVTIGNVGKKVVVLGGAGNDVIDAATNIVGVLLDGGEGNDQLTAGQGDDVLIAGSGINILIGGNGNNRFVGGGSDTMHGGINVDYYEVHFSDVILIDDGGVDTVDLSGAQAGVTLNLSSNTGTPQPVFAGSTLALNGSFENLVGSSYSDRLSTNTPGTSVNGGGGNDTLISSASGVTLNGGDGDDTAILTGAVGNTVSGGDGNNTITGTLSGSVLTTITTGTGNSTINVSGPVGSTTPVTISVGKGTNSIAAKNISGYVYGNNGSTTSSSQAFGSSLSTSSISVTNSSNVSIFGSSTPTSEVYTTGSSNVSIYSTGLITLDSTTSASIVSTTFGSSLTTPTNTTVTNSSNVGVFGSSALDNVILNTDVINSSNVSVFSSLARGGTFESVLSSNVQVFSATGKVTFDRVIGTNNTIEASQFGSSMPTTLDLNITNSSSVGVFGSTNIDGPILEGVVSNSSNVSIFAASAPVGTLLVTSSSNVSISALSSGNIRLDSVANASVAGSSFGSSTGTLTVAVTNSSNVGVFGSSALGGPGLTVTVTNSQNVGVYSSLSLTITDATIVDSSNVTVFGSSVINGGSLDTTIYNSSNVGVFGSSTGHDLIEVTNSSNVGIFSLTSSIARLTEVNTATVSLSNFGSSIPTVITVTNSQNVGIFGSTETTGSALSTTVTGSSNVGVFGSSTGSNTVFVSNSSNVGVYASFNDTIGLSNVNTAYIQGGAFGSSTLGQGVTVSVDTGSSNVGVFGTPLTDTINVGLSSRVWINAGLGDDQISIDGGQQIVAIGDAGADRVTVRSGYDMLIYLGEGNDRAEVLGGTLIRIIGEAGDDQFALFDGASILFDGGIGNDLFEIFGGKDIYVRGDAGSDLVNSFGGIGQSISGGADADQLRVFGSLGGALDTGLVYALLDGQDGNDTVEARPLLSAADRGLNATAVTAPYLSIPTWIAVPNWVSSPSTTTLPSSIALVGGIGDDTLWLQGDQRLYGLAGDGNDIVTLQAGTNSEISGGFGSDAITNNASGLDNRIFGDQGNDTIVATAGQRLAIFGEEDADTITFTDGLDSFARGGAAADQLNINGGRRITLVGEDGNDTATIRAGFSGLASGSLGNDTLQILGGDQGVLLGQSGDDSLMLDGGTHSVASGGDGDDTLRSSSRGNDLYGDDGDDSYQLTPATAATLTQAQLERLRELLFVDPNSFEAESRGSDTIDLSQFSSAATINLGITGVYNSFTTGLQTVVAGQLQLILLGSLENVIGTNFNDTLIGSAEPNRIQGAGGNDILQGLNGDDTLDGGPGDDTLSGGLGDDLYVFSSSNNVALGSDRVLEATSGGNDRLDFSNMPTGIGTLDLAVAAPQNLASGLLSLTINQSTSNAARGDIEEVVGTAFNDTVLGNELDNRMELGIGNDTMDGRGGSDVYVFAGSGLGSDQVLDASTGTGRDTLDFTAFDAPLNLDLSSTSAQDLAELTLTLATGDAIENVIGTSFDDVITGNARDNAIFGAAGVDRLDGRAGNDRLVADLPAIVLLDFDSAYRVDRGDYNYSAAERNSIQQRLQNAYSTFNWTFTQSESQARSLSSDMGRNFVRVAFSQGRGGGISGDAGGVDFRNIQRSGITEVNINSLLPTVRSLLLTQIGPNYTTQDVSNMVVALTSTIAAHELGHSAGLRHGDAFGPIGSGIFIGTDTSNIYPPYSGALTATETAKHFIASPDSVGSSIADAVGNLYFGERESIKLAFDEIGRTNREASAIAGSHGSIATAENLGALFPLAVPNLAPIGSSRAGQSFKVAALNVIGDLRTFTNGATEQDFYRFTGQAGEYVNVELLANSLRPARGTGFDGQLQIFKSDGTLLAINDDDLEGTKDSTLLDVRLPLDGDYYIAVGLSISPAFIGTGGRYELFISRFATGPTGSVKGDTLIGGAGSDTLIGGAADDLFLAQGTVQGDVDTLDGRKGFNTLDTQGFNYNYIATSIQNILSTGNAPPTTTIAGPLDGLVGQSITFRFTATDSDTVDQNGPFQFSINWGDGTTSAVTSPTGQSFIQITHIYNAVSATGTFTVSAIAKDARGLSGPASTFVFAATGLSVLLDPINPGKNILVVVGSRGSDIIRIAETDHDNLKIRIREKDTNLKIRGRVDGDVDRLLIFALDGDDTVTINGDSELQSEIWGGRGNDYLAGGDGKNIIWGEAGDDVILGGESRDILIGGTGADVIKGNDRDDILIAGLTAYDNEFNQQAPSAFGPAQRLTLNAQRLAIEAIMAEWSSSRSYTARVSNIMGSGSGPRFNGSYVLRVNDNNLLQNTVFDDGAADRLWGEDGADWFFANLDGENRTAVDRIMDGECNEIRTDLDKWW